MTAIEGRLFFRIWAYVMVALNILLFIYMLSFGAEFNALNYPAGLMMIIRIIYMLSVGVGFGGILYSVVAKDRKIIFTSLGIFTSTFVMFVFYVMLMLSPIH